MTLVPFISKITVKNGVKEVYIRSGNQSIRAPRYILEELILKGRNRTYDSIVTNYFKENYSFSFFEATFLEKTLILL